MTTVIFSKIYAITGNQRKIQKWRDQIHPFLLLFFKWQCRHRHYATAAETVLWLVGWFDTLVRPIDRSVCLIDPSVRTHWPVSSDPLTDQFGPIDPSVRTHWLVGSVPLVWPLPWPVTETGCIVPMLKIVAGYM